jgi:hypothetical protein
MLEQGTRQAAHAGSTAAQRAQGAAANVLHQGSDIDSLIAAVPLRLKRALASTGRVLQRHSRTSA